MEVVKQYSHIEALRTQMISDRSRYIPGWQQQAYFLSPKRFRNNPFDKHDGTRKNQKIVRNVGGLALRAYQSGMMNGSTPQARPWFKLTAADYKINSSPAVKQYFAQCETIMNNYFQISNTYRVFPMAYKDVGTFSNAAFAQLPHPRYGTIFMPFAMGTYCMASDSEGLTKTFMREFSLSVRQVVEQYVPRKPDGHLDWSWMDPWVKEAWEQCRYQDVVYLANMILPNDYRMDHPLLSHHKAYQSYTWITAGISGAPSQSAIGFRQTTARDSMKVDKLNNGMFISIKGFDYFPIITPRSEVLPEEDWGSEGPGELALSAIQTLQEQEKWRMEATAKLVKPPMVGPASLRRHQASILAGGITYMDETAATDRFRPAFEIDPKLAELVSNQLDYEEEINECFYKNLFQMLAGESPKSHVTAREIEERAGEKLAALAPALGQLDDDMKGPVIENQYFVLNQQGRLPPPPRELQGTLIRPEYTSVLAQAAKAAQMNTLERGYGFIVQFANSTGNTGLLKAIKGYETLQEVWDYTGANPALIATEQEYQEIQQIEVARQQQAQAQAQAQQEAATAKDLSQAKVGEGSMLDQVI